MRVEPGGWWDLPALTEDEMERLARQRRRLRLALWVGTIASSGVVVLTAVLASPAPSHGIQRPVWLWWAIALVPTALIVVVAVVVDRAGQRPGPGLWLSATVDARTVQTVARQLSRGEPLEGADRIVASAILARRGVAALRLRWLYLAMMALYLGGAVVLASPVRWFFAVLAAFSAFHFFLVPRGGQRLTDKAAAQGITAADPGPPWASSKRTPVAKS